MYEHTLGAVLCTSGDTSAPGVSCPTRFHSLGTALTTLVVTRRLPQRNFVLALHVIQCLIYEVRNCPAFPHQGDLFVDLPHDPYGTAPDIQTCAGVGVERSMWGDGGMTCYPRRLVAIIMRLIMFKVTQFIGPTPAYGRSAACDTREAEAKPTAVRSL